MAAESRESEVRGRPEGAEAARLRRRMFARVALSALARSRGRLVIALASVVIGAMTVSAMSGVYSDLDSKMSRELRRYGANVALAPASSEGFSDAELAQVLARVPGDKLVGAAPYLYGLGDAHHAGASRRLVIAGTDFGQAVRVSPYWKIEGRVPREGRAALLGIEAAKSLGVKPGDSLVLNGPAPATTRAARVSVTSCVRCHEDPARIHLRIPSAQGAGEACGSCHRPHPLSGPGAPVRFTVSGVLSTGGDEDAQVFLSLPDARALLGKPRALDAAFLSIMGSTDEVSAIARAVTAEKAGVEAKPIKRVSESEGKVLLKLASLFSLVVAVVLAAAALCVGITMTAMAMERRREIGLKKALGADDRLIAAEFLGEALLFGIVGGVLGWAIGFGLAQWIGRAVFGSGVAFHLVTVPLTLFVSLVMTGAAALAPVRMAARIDPAVVLKEE